MFSALLTAKMHFKPTHFNQVLQNRNPSYNNSSSTFQFQTNSSSTFRFKFQLRNLKNKVVYSAARRGLP